MPLRHAGHDRRELGYERDRHVGPGDRGLEQQRGASLRSHRSHLLTIDLRPHLVRGFRHQGHHVLECLACRSRDEHAQALRAPIELVGDPRQAEVAGAPFAGEPVHRAVAEPERQVHREHVVPRREVEQQLARIRDPASRAR